MDGIPAESGSPGGGPAGVPAEKVGENPARESNQVLNKCSK